MKNIPQCIKDIIGNRNFEIDNIGMSDSKVLCFDDMILKIQNNDDEAKNEINMMKWLKEKLPVPEKICCHIEDDKSYILMSKVQGKMSCDEEYLNNAEKLVGILAQGLKMMWSVDITGCPCDCSIDKKLKLAEDRVVNNLCSMENVEEETYGENGFGSPKELLKWLKDNKPNEELVLSHGDYCLPNVFIENDNINGFIDLGRSGLGDKYIDIALCYRSLVHNFEGRYGGKVYKDFDANILFEKLEIKPDWEKIKYYILLDELF